MEPRIVEQAPMAPGQCLFSQDIDGPWIDTGVRVPWINPYGYISAKYVEYLARELLGMVPEREVKKEIEELQEQVASYGERVESLAALTAALEDFGDEFKEGEEF